MKATSTSSAAILTLVVVAACGSLNPNTTPTSFTGVLTFASFNPYTGPDAGFGPEMSAGCIAAVNVINQSGGVLGHQTQCVETDTRGDAGFAVSAAQKMLASTSNLVGINGPSSDEALATVPIIDRGHIPMFADTGQAAFDKSTYGYFYRLTAPDDAAGVAMAVYAYRKGYRRGAAVFGNDLSSQGNVPNLLTAFQKLGGTIVINQTLTVGQTSFRTEVDALIAAKPDVIFTESDPQSAAAYLGELDNLHVLLPVIGTQPTVQPPWATAVAGAIGKASLAYVYAGAQPYSASAGPAWEIYNTMLLALGSQIPQPAQWSQDPYSQKYYDAVIIMALAMLEAKAPEPSAYNPFIANVVSSAPDAVEVHSFNEGMVALKSGQKIRYAGAGGPIVFDSYRNSGGPFELVGYAADGSNPQLAVISAAEIARLRS